MVRDPFASDAEPEFEDVVGSIEDPDCRAIIRTLEEPMTARELAERCDIPTSTTYRKLEKMTDATLLEELTEIRSSGHHTTRYRIDFTEVRVELEEDRSLALTISRPARSPDERLEFLWSEVRKEVD